MPIVCRKLVKIAENYYHNIDPWYMDKFGHSFLRKECMEPAVDRTLVTNSTIKNL
jgi:hypothetical protein